MSPADRPAKTAAIAMSGTDSPCTCRIPAAAPLEDVADGAAVPVAVPVALTVAVPLEVPLGVEVPEPLAGAVLLPGWLIWSSASGTTLRPVMGLPLLSFTVAVTV